MKKQNTKNKKLRIIILLIGFSVVSFFSWFDLRGISYNFKLDKNKLYIINQTLAGGIVHSVMEAVYPPKYTCYVLLSDEKSYVKNEADCNIDENFLGGDIRRFIRIAYTGIIIFIVWTFLMVFVYNKRFDLAKDLKDLWDDI
jgi:hypothetical protein